MQMPTMGASKRETSSEHPDSTLLSLEDLAQIQHSPISVLDRGQPGRYPWGLLINTLTPEGGGRPHQSGVMEALEK